MAVLPDTVRDCNRLIQNSRIVFTRICMKFFFDTTHRGQTSIFTLIANSGSLHKFDNSCTARIFSLHDFQTILNAKDYACRGLCMHNLKIDLPPDPGPVSMWMVDLALVVPVLR